MPDFDRIEAGITGEQEVVVEAEHTTSRTGRPILTTPEMIRLMERISADLVEPLLPEGFTSVGFEVHIRHRAPAPLGSTVRVWSCLREVQENRLRFDVRVRMESTLIGEGIHRRTIISTTPAARPG